MLTPVFEESFSREIAEILETFGRNIRIWHGTQTNNIRRMLRIRRRQAMITWFRQNHYPVQTRAPPVFEGSSMVLHLLPNNFLSGYERRFVDNPTPENLPTLLETAVMLQPYELTNNNIIDRMMGPDPNENRMSNQYENINLSIARGSVGDEGFRLHEVEGVRRVQPDRQAKNKNKNSDL
jgi:hypothetical protein